MKHAWEPRSRAAVSALLEDGRIVELVYARQEGRTAFVMGSGGAWEEHSTVESSGERLVPYAPDNNLLRSGVVLFPERPEEYGSSDKLRAEIEEYVDRYVDISAAFRRLTAHYVLLTWVYDRFNELPYLRLKGEYGSGKTRFLLTVGAICYKPIFASGASTVSPLFHLLDSVGGTLILDEADFRFSDAKAEIVKILNNGHARGFPVLRSEAKGRHEFNPRAFQVFGPKIVAMRGQFEDPALESRFITERTAAGRLRKGIPLNLPREQTDEAQALRNQLLLFRLRNYQTMKPAEAPVDTGLEPRVNQIYAPLAAVVSDAAARRAVVAMARRCDQALRVERGASLEAQVLTVMRFLVEEGKGSIAVSEIGSLFGAVYGKEYEGHVTSRWIGGIIRRKLGLATQKSHGVFVVPLSEREKLDRLFERYGVDVGDADGLAEAAARLPSRLRFEQVDFGDLGDV
jgi:hypothetical protein